MLVGCHFINFPLVSINTIGDTQVSIMVLKSLLMIV
jgi:hypothetical protein